jgi:hypothetical protein
MNTFGALVPMNDLATLTKPSAEQNQAVVGRLIALAVRGLKPMFDPHRQLFCYKLKKSEQGIVQEGLSHRYTMMTLMGLHCLEQSGAVSPFNTERIMQSLLSDLTWVDNLGDLGVLLWLCSTVFPERLPEIESQLKIKISSALERYRGAKDGVTMELAWFLTGISYWGLARPEKLAHLQPLAFETYRMLTKNQGDRGFFGHLSTSRSLMGMARGRIGSFADQVYPIYAFTQFFRAYQSEEAVKRATKCAMGICEVQGPLGQWWWHYDSSAGRVTDGYPVFSVHQHAMAPMTLFALGDAIGFDFDPWIYKGLRWINSNNALRFEMEDASCDVIWRCIFRSRRSAVHYLRARFGRHLDPVEHEQQGELKILFECRPYELGWLLYAFASRI